MDILAENILTGTAVRVWRGETVCSFFSHDSLDLFLTLSLELLLEVTRWHAVDAMNLVPVFTGF